MTTTLINPSTTPREPASAPETGQTDVVGCPQCGQPALVEWRFEVGSTDGLVEHVKIRCAARHWFLMPSAGLR